MTTTSYTDALDQAIEALRRGEQLDDVLARFPEHEAVLREDLSLRDAVAGLDLVVPASRDEARAAASARLQTQLANNRAAASQAPAVPWWRLGLPRFAVAIALAVVAIVGLALVSLGGNDSAEATTLEGVVVENSGDSLTIQTLDAMEQVQVPADALVADDAGASVALDRIAVGQVVVVEVDRSGDSIVARRIRRLFSSIDEWCSDRNDRCAVLAEQLQRASEQCDSHPAACRALVDRVTDLRARALLLARLEELKTSCREGERPACEELVLFCAQSDVCGDLAPKVPSPDEAKDLRERLRSIYQDCRGGDEAACRQLAVLCTNNPAVCPEDVPLPAATPLTDRLESAPTARPVDTQPQTTPTERPQPTPVVDTRPTATPVQEVTDREASPGPAVSDVQPTPTGEPQDVTTPAGRSSDEPATEGNAPSDGRP